MNGKSETDIKAVIFDFDGVICVTDHFHYYAWKELADRLGIYFDETINNRLRGVGRLESLDIILERSDAVYSPEEKKALAEEKNTRYRQLLSTLTPDDLSPRVMYTLMELRRRGYLLSVGSSSRNTGFTLERLGMDSFFDIVVDGWDISHSKPDPEVFLKTAQRLGLSPEDCIVVEDAEAGIEAAKAAGMKAVLLSDNPEDDGKADWRLCSFEKLLTILPEKS